MADRVRDRRDRSWSWFHDDVIKLYGRELGPYGISVYMAMLTFADSKNRTCYPSMHQIAEMTGMSRRQVISSVQKLEGLKLIGKRRRFDKGNEPASNFYTILTPEGSAQDSPGSEYHAPGGAPYAPLDDVNENKGLDDSVVNTMHQVVNTVHIGSEYGAHELDVFNQSKEKDTLHPPSQGESAPSSPEKPSRRVKRIHEQPKHDPQGFKRFYEPYPKHTHLQDAIKEWDLQRPTPELREVIVANVEARARADPEWLKENGKYAPNPAAYLSHGRWTDEWKPQAKRQTRFVE